MRMIERRSALEGLNDATNEGESVRLSGDEVTEVHSLSPYPVREAAQPDLVGHCASVELVSVVSRQL